MGKTYRKEKNYFYSDDEVFENNKKTSEYREKRKMKYKKIDDFFYEDDNANIHR